MKKLFVEVKNGDKMTYSVSDLNKLDRMYETEVLREKKKKSNVTFQERDAEKVFRHRSEIMLLKNS